MSERIEPVWVDPNVIRHLEADGFVDNVDLFGYRPHMSDYDPVPLYTAERIREMVEDVRGLAKGRLEGAAQAQYNDGIDDALDAILDQLQPSGKYRVCTECEIHHYENCGSCYGFGVYEEPGFGGRLLPIVAIRAHENRPLGPPLPCPECGSTIEGVPQGEPQ